MPLAQHSDDWISLSALRAFGGEQIIARADV